MCGVQSVKRINVTVSITHTTCTQQVLRQRSTMGDGPPETPDVGAEVLGLTEVEPSPVDETPIEFKEGYFPATSPRSNSPTTSLLGLGTHGPAYYRKEPYPIVTYLVLTFMQLPASRNTPPTPLQSSPHFTLRTLPSFRSSPSPLPKATATSFLHGPITNLHLRNLS